MEKLQVPSGYRLELVAAEPEVLNMVALSVDVDGSIFVAETDRYQDAVFDVVTMRPDWLPMDLSLRTVKDRTQFLKQTFRDDLTFLGRGSERLRRLTDFDGDGVMEQSDVLAEGF
ncbi:MAG: glucose dehydrogenase, partial [Verrucomicrobiota bacterium]